MTLIEARKILEGMTPKSGKEREAIKAAVALLPREEDKPEAGHRLAEIIGMIGHDPFNGMKHRIYVVWRQCVIYKLAIEGYTNAEITRATKLNHATIYYSIQNVEDGMRYRDKLINKIWAELLEKTT